MINVIDNVFRTKFNDEFKEDFSRNKPLLLKTVRSDGLMAGSSIKWDVVNPSDVAERRTRDGNIPVSQLELSQVTGTPVEDLKKYRIDDFDAFRANPNVRAIMSKKARESIYRAIDQAIITELDTATLAINSGSAIGFNLLSTFLSWTVTLWNNDVQNDGRVWGLLTPAAMAQMERIEEFKNSRYVEARPMQNGIPAQEGYREWKGVKWVMHTGLTGVGTATAKCYIYHEDAIGHQIHGEPEVHPYWFESEARHECWARAWHVAKVCLNRGIIRAVHDDTAAFA